MERFTKLFGSLIVFVYHCFDRIVIQGYLSGLSRPEQVVYFFRQVLGIPVVSKEVLRQRTDDYRGWVEAYARNHKLPMEWAEKCSLRRAELAALRVEHIQRHRKGITILIPQSKTDQEKKGREVEILYGIHDRTCPILALDNWLKIAGIQDGYVLRRVGRHGNVGDALDKDSIGRIVKRLVGRAKIGDPKDYGGHSLRADFVTEASANGATDREIMKQTGHKTVAMVHRYAREDQADWQSAESKLGL
ncbi:MAG: site-specific integrase [Acidobacteriaceae bacterium]